MIFLFSQLVFLLFVILFMSRQIKLIFKMRKEYFKHFYSYINLAIIGLAWAGFAGATARYAPCGSKINPSTHQQSTPTSILGQFDGVWFAQRHQHQHRA